ncbi:MAG: hypothetical protein E7196_05305 [Anaerovibrio lipolyticus]|nr:hypothetical protein [Anaerovibrio lipolyticus]
MNRDVRFFCPNPNCNAALYVCSRNGSKRPYFAANRPGKRHIEGGCMYSCDIKFDPNNTDEGSFKFQNAIEKLFVTSIERAKANQLSAIRDKIEGNKKPLRTLRQIYDMCRSYHAKDCYAGVEIWRMILDDRTVKFYTKGCFGYHLVAGKIDTVYYDANKLSVNVYVIIGINKYNICLRFKETKLFKFVRDEVYNNKGNYMIVASYWKSANLYSMNGEINTKKQILVIKNKR